METYRLHQNSYQMRTFKHKGLDHLIVPVIMMREGVHSGSHGPLLHTTEELAKTVEAWNGQPVVINHPKNKQGVYVSANLPEIREVEEVGMVFNTKMDGDKLKAELWLNVNKMTEKALTALAAIRSLKPMDVSVGIFSDEEPAEGEWNGEAYQAIARNHRPDHLAILPGEQGACSWADGCGIRVNKSGEENELQINRIENKLTTNGALSFDEIARKLHGELRKQDTFETDSNGDSRPLVYNYVTAVYPDYMIYEKEVRKENKASYYKQGYALTAAQEVELVGEPIEVKREIVYIPIQQINVNKQKNGGTKMTPCCKEKVANLIAHASTPWNEKHREWLESQEEPIIDSLVTQMERKVTNDEAIQVLSSGVKNTADVLNWLPEGSPVRAEIEAGLALHSAERKEKIEHILNNTKEVWSEEQLNGMSTEVIANIAKSIQTNTTVDYSAQGNVQVNHTGGDEVLLPGGISKK